MAKQKTLRQVRAMQAKAAQFLRDVVGDEERGAEFEAMTPEEYAEHKGVEIVEGNPATTATMTITRRKTMPTKQDLEERLEELEQENEELQDRLDQIADLSVPEEDEEDSDGEDGELEGEDGEDDDAEADEL